jgi:hypothetical protein
VDGVLLPESISQVVHVGDVVAIGILAFMDQLINAKSNNS